MSIVFPTLPSGAILDSTKYDVTRADPAMRTETDGGYVVSRARYTRTPRRIFKVGYTYITNADKAALDAFYDTVKGGSLIFDWTDPASGNVYSVRLKSPFAFKYAGAGNTRIWDCSFELEQA